jgi:hypothetical protein
MSINGFKRVWSAPRAAMKGATLQDLTARGKWLYDYSKQRAMNNPDVVVLPPFTGEVGSWQGFTFIEGLP